jgi:hypothetical protein
MIDPKTPPELGKRPSGEHVEPEITDLTDDDRELWETVCAKLRAEAEAEGQPRGEPQ